MMRHKGLRSDGGATAIEYAIIAGLIGLGLVGSLVSTRGSLSSVYGTAASQMGSGAPSDSSYLPTGSVVSKWSSKSLASVTTTGTKANYTTQYKFTDGSSVTFARATRRTVTFIDTAVDPYKTIIIQPDGPGGSGSAASKPYYIANSYLPSGQYTGQQSQQDLLSSDVTNTGSSDLTTYYYTPGQGPTSYAVSRVNLADYASYFNDVAYFTSIQ